MSAPKVSAIVPTYRRPQLLPRALDSVLAQSWRPLELVVIDDGGGDETPQVAQAYGEKAAAAGVEFKFMSVANGGPGNARNAGINVATGALFAFLDDDDAWHAEKLALQVPALLARPQAGICFTQYVHAGREGEPKPPETRMRDGWCFEGLCRGDTRAHLQTLLVRREVIDRVGGFAPLYNFEDTEFCLRASLEFEFVALARPLTVIHGSGGTVSREQGLEGDLKRDALKLKVLDEFTAAHGGHQRFSADALKHLRARVFDEHVKHLLWLGRFADARASHARAIGECGELPLLRDLRAKLRKARVLGWFGLRLRKP